MNEKLTYLLYGQTCGKSEPHLLGEGPVEAWMCSVLKQKEEWKALDASVWTIHDRESEHHCHRCSMPFICSLPRHTAAFEHLASSCPLFVAAFHCLPPAISSSPALPTSSLSLCLRKCHWNKNTCQQSPGCIICSKRRAALWFDSYICFHFRGNFQLLGALQINIK